MKYSEWLPASVAAEEALHDYARNSPREVEMDRRRAAVAALRVERRYRLSEELAVEVSFSVRHVRSTDDKPCVVSLSFRDARNPSHGWCGDLTVLELCAAAQNSRVGRLVDGGPSRRSAAVWRLRADHVSLRWGGDAMNSVIVIAGVLANDRGEVFMQKRRLDKMRPGLWEHPGGKMEPGEGINACLQREWREELGVDVEVGATICEVAFSAEVDLVVHFCQVLWRPSGWTGVNLCEGQLGAGYVHPAYAVRHLPLSPASYLAHRAISVFLKQDPAAPPPPESEPPPEYVPVKIVPVGLVTPENEAEKLAAFHGVGPGEVLEILDEPGAYRNQRRRPNGHLWAVLRAGHGDSARHQFLCAKCRAWAICPWERYDEMCPGVPVEQAVGVQP